MSEGARLFDAAEQAWAKTPTAEVSYRRIGSGPPLVFIHGWPLWSFTFRKLLPWLKDHVTCYLLDAPGGGYTRVTRETKYTWPAQAKTIQSALDEILGDQEYFLFGQDSGAMIARELCLIDSERIVKLVMTNTEIPGHRPPGLPLVRELLFLPGIWKGLQWSLRCPWFVRHEKLGFGGCLDDVSLIDGEFEERIIRPLARNGARMRGHAEFLKGWSWELLDRWKETHRHLVMPVLLIWGRNDGNFPLEGGNTPNAKRMQGQIPDARLVVVDGARLWVQEEKPEEVARAVIDFLRTADTRPTEGSKSPTLVADSRRRSALDGCC